MFIQESVKLRHVSAIAVAILSTGIIRHVSAIGIAILSTSIRILSAGITIAQVRVAGVEIFLSHERVGPSADLLFHTRVVLKIRIELRMALQVLRVVDQGRRFAKLVGNFAMAIEKLIKSRQVPARDVIAWDSLPVLRGRSLDSLPVLRGRSLDSLLVLRGRRLRVRGTRETQRHHRSTDN